HLARDATASLRGGDDPVAQQRCLLEPDGVAGPDRGLSHGWRDLALAVWRVDLCALPGSADRVPVTRARRGGAVAHCVPRRGPCPLPRAQAPVSAGRARGTHARLRLLV